MTGRRRGARGRDERGSTALEFGIVVLVFVLAVFGLIQYGYHYWSLETASATAREAARRMSVGTAWDCTQAEAVARAAMPAVGTTAPTVTVSYGNAANRPVVGGLVTVEVRFQSLDLGIVPVPAGGVVVASETARVENVPAAPLSCL